MKMKTTETTAANTTYRYEEPNHDEIALAAFLAWEKDGQQAGREMDYWLQAESQLREARQKKAEAAAAQASLPWPRPTRATAVKKPVTNGSEKLTTSARRSTTPKASARATTRK